MHTEDLHDTHCAQNVIFFTTAQQPPIGPWPPYYRGFTITLRHTTLSRASSDQ